MKVYEIALEKIKEYNRMIDKVNKIGRWGALIMLSGYIILTLFSDNILIIFGSTPEIVSSWERKIPLIWMLISVITFMWFFIKDLIQRAKLEHRYDYYFKYSSKEINKFLSWKKDGFDVDITRNYIKNIVNKHYSDKNILVDEIMSAVESKDFRTELFHIKEYKKFIEEFDVED
jgi:hypothetical protein